MWPQSWDRCDEILCEVVGKIYDPSCANKIKLWHDALNPFFILQANLTHLPRSEFVPGIGLGVGKCPYDPIDNSTAIYVEKGNPGGFPALVRDLKLFFMLSLCSNFYLAVTHSLWDSETDLENRKWSYKPYFFDLKVRITSIWTFPKPIFSVERLKWFMQFFSSLKMS